jgi:hypothetical protein
MPEKENNIIAQLRGFDAEHYAATERYARQIERLYNTACDEFARIGAGIEETEAVFSFDKLPKTRKQAQGILTRLVGKMEAVITTGTKAEWLAACKKNDAFIAAILRTAKLTKEEVEQYQSRNLEALRTFQRRKVEGLGLSERVWKYAGELKDAMELGIDVALGEGKSAQELSRDLRSYLQEPHRLYRRVRDKGGNLRLSKAAKLYHPGQGVYRSSAKNAQRLARTEVNMAYRESEFLRWQKLDFVVGLRVMLSNNHTTTNSKGEKIPLVDICDELWGDYPKTFKFTGWHPQCRCFVVPILSDYDEYNQDRANRLKAIVRKAHYESLPSRRTITDVPAKFREYIDSIKERAKGWKSMPYYIRDNFKGGKIEGGLNANIPTKTMNNVKPCTEFDREINYLKRWAYALGGDMSNIDALRTAGNREALEAEIEKVRDVMDGNLDKWHDAQNELSRVITVSLKGYSDIQNEFSKILQDNASSTKRYYGDCISRLKQAVKDALAKLAKAKEEEANSGYSKNMPEELKKGGIWLRGDDYTYSKEFFDLIDESKPIRITIHSKTGNDSYFSPTENRVYLDKKRRSEESHYYRKALIYHEFGHGIDWQRGLRYSQEIKDLREKQIKRLKKQVVQTKEKTYFDGTKMEYVTKQVKTRVMYAKSISERLDRLYSKIRSMKDETFVKRGITKQDVIEQIAAVQDTLKSLISSVGWGHSTSYFKTKGFSEAEYIAHCFENAFIGNRIFQKYLPTEYAEMIAFIKSLK